MPQVAAPARFASGLPGTQGLPPIVQPLGHEVSALATPGLVVARSRPVEITAGGSIPAPVQRRASRGSKAAAAAASLAVAAPEAEVVEHHHDAPAATAATAPSAPIRSMPTVSRSAIRVPDRPLTSAASAAPPAVQRASAATSVATAGAAPSAPLPPVASGMRRAPSTVQRSETAAAAAPAPSSPYRSGLGEPMTSLPASARPVAAPGPVISRSTTSGPMPIAAAGLRAPIQPKAAGTPAKTPLGLPAGSPPPTAAGTPRLPDLPSLPVLRQATAAPAAAAARPPAPAPTSAPAPEIRPIAGANPIRTSVALQRETADDASDDADDGEALPTPWWGSSEPPSRPAMAGVGVDPAPTTIQRSAIAANTPASSPFASRTHLNTPASVAHGRAPVQRSAAPAARPSLPSLMLPHAPGRGPATSPAPAPANEVPAPAISTPLRSVVSDPVVQTSPARSSGSPFASGLGAGAVVQREGNVAVAAPTPTEPAAPGPSIAPGGGGGGQPARGSGHSERDLDELAMALFGRIRSRLRTDLIHDREAKGLTFDNV